MKRFLIALTALLAVGWSAPALAAGYVGVTADTVATCGTPNVTPTAGADSKVTADTAGKLCVNATVSASIAAFAPTNIFNGANGFGSGITGTSSKFALTGAGASSSLLVTNANTTDGIYVELCPTSTCTATSLNGTYVGPGSSVVLNIGANTEIAGISTGSGPDVTYVAAGTGLPALAGGGAGGGGGGGGAVTIASGAVASGAYSSGSIASGAFASGSVGSGAIASGAVASGAVASGAIASGACATGCIVDLGTATSPSAGTVNAQLATIATAVAAATPAGTNLIGKVGVDQTTPGTTNNVTVSTNVGTLPLVQATASAAITFTAAGGPTQIIAASGSTKIYVTHIHYVVSGAGTFALITGTGTNCGTGTTYLEGASGHPLSFAANGGISAGGGLGPIYVTGAGGEICAITTGSVDTSGVISYAQF